MKLFLILTCCFLPLLIFKKSNSNPIIKNKRFDFVQTMFVFVFRPTREFQRMWGRHYCRIRSAHFDLYSAFVAIDLLPSVRQWSCHYLLNDLGLSRLGFEHQTFRMQGEHSNRLHHRIFLWNLNSINYRHKNWDNIFGYCFWVFFLPFYL